MAAGRAETRAIDASRAPFSRPVWFVVVALVAFAAWTTVARADDSSSNPAAGAASSTATDTGAASTPTDNTPTDSAPASTDTSSSAAGNGNGAAKSNANPQPDNTSTNSASGNATGNANGNGNGNGNPQNGSAPASTDTSSSSTSGDQGNGNGPTAGSDSSNSQGSGNGQGNGDANANANSNQSKPGNTNVGVRVGQAGDNGGTSQENTSSADAGASATADGNVGPGADTSANANANANQDNPSNLNVDVRVNSPGNGGPVDQQNNADAGANAQADGTATASADASQTSPDNVNVSIRVGSAGDQGPVSQQNTADATAGDGSAGAAQIALSGDAAATVTNDGTLDQQLAQCPEGACAPGEVPTGTDATGNGNGNGNSNGSARSSQTDPSNVNVSVRVGSPGNDGNPNQQNRATASGDTASATTTGDNNLNVVVVVPGDTTATVPDGSEPWTWTWNWTGDSTPTSSDTPTSTSDWTWNWSSDPAPPTPPTPEEGHWIWTWTWTQSDGWTVTYTSDQECDCTWVWVWTWNWDTPPPSVPPQTAEPATGQPTDAPQVTQTNTAQATAQATSTTTATQVAPAPSVPGQTTTDGPSSSVTQLIDSAQSAEADATARQQDVTNFSFVGAGVLDSLSQANTAQASAAATAVFVVGQAVVQSQSGAVEGVLQVANVAQAVGNSQIAQAFAFAQQTQTRNASSIWSTSPSSAPIGAIVQSNIAAAAAAAVDRAAVQQLSFQTQIGAGQEQTADASQTFLNSQSATASASTSQIRVANLNDVLIPAFGISNPALTQTNELSTAALAGNTGTGAQTLVQAAAGAFVEWHETAAQEGLVQQSGDAGSGLVAADRTNFAGWRGQIALPSTPGGSAPAAPQPEPLTAPRLFSPHGFFVHRTTGLARPSIVTEVLTQNLQTHHTRHATAARPATAAQRAPAVTDAKGRVLPSPSSPVRLPIAFGSVTAPALAAALPTMRAIGADTSGWSMRRSHGPSEHAPFCPQSCGNGSLFGSAFAGAGGASFGGFAAALTPFRLFAAPGAGRLQPEAPDLGRPADTAPIERPG